MLFPLDEYVDSPVAIMQKTPQDIDLHLPHIDDYRKILADNAGNPIKIAEIERFLFYKRAKDAFAIVHSG
jgi:L-fucose mutarotase